MGDELAILQRAYDLIADRKHWTRGTMARDAHGHDLDLDHNVSSPKAVRFCATGALIRASNDLSSSPTEVNAVRNAVVECLAASGYSGGIVPNNDTPIKEGGAGHKGILKAFECAINKFKEKP